MTTRTSHSSTTGSARRIQARLRRGVGLLGAAGVGFLLAMQSRVNGTLGNRLGDGLAAAVVSFGGGLLVLLVITAVTPSARAGFRQLARTVLSPGGLRPWQCVGGVCGAFLVFSQGVSASVLGVALFTVAAVGGQVASGMLVDRFGLGPGAAQPVTAPRVIGAVLAVGAVVIAVSTQLGQSTASWLVILPALAGIGVAWQQGVNGLVKQTSESAVTTAALNFATGTAALLVAYTVAALLRGFPQHWPDAPWLYLGGVIGIFVVGGAAVVVRYTGVLLLSMGLVSGQLFGALLLDLVMPTPGTRVAVTTVVGVCLTFVAVAVATLPQRTRPRGR